MEYVWYLCSKPTPFDWVKVGKVEVLAKKVRFARSKNWLLTENISPTEKDISGVLLWKGERKKENGNKNWIIKQIKYFLLIDWLIN